MKRKFPMKNHTVNQPPVKSAIPIKWYIARTRLEASDGKIGSSSPSTVPTSDLNNSKSNERITSITHINSACRIERYETVEDSGSGKAEGSQRSIVFNDLDIASNVRVEKQPISKYKHRYRKKTNAHLEPKQSDSSPQAKVEDGGEIVKSKESETANDISNTPSNQKPNLANEPTHQGSMGVSSKAPPPNPLEEKSVAVKPEKTVILKAPLSPASSKVNGERQPNLTREHKNQEEAKVPDDTSHPHTSAKVQVAGRPTLTYKRRNQEAYMSLEAKGTRQLHKTRECAETQKLCRKSDEKCGGKQLAPSASDCKKGHAVKCSPSKIIEKRFLSYTTKFKGAADVVSKHPPSNKRQIQSNQAVDHKREVKQIRGKEEKNHPPKEQHETKNMAAIIQQNYRRCYEHKRWLAYIAARRSALFPRKRSDLVRNIVFEPQVKGKLVSVVHVNPACRIERYELPESCETDGEGDKRSEQIPFDYAAFKRRDHKVLRKARIVTPISVPLETMHEGREI